MKIVLFLLGALIFATFHDASGEKMKASKEDKQPKVLAFKSLSVEIYQVVGCGKCKTCFEKCLKCVPCLYKKSKECSLCKPCGPCKPCLKCLNWEEAKLE